MQRASVITLVWAKTRQVNTVFTCHIKYTEEGNCSPVIGRKRNTKRLTMSLLDTEKNIPDTSVCRKDSASQSTTSIANWSVTLDIRVSFQSLWVRLSFSIETKASFTGLLGEIFLRSVVVFTTWLGSLWTASLGDGSEWGRKCKSNRPLLIRESKHQLSREF